MKIQYIAITFLLISIFAISNVIAACSLEATLINQDPYPATQGDYVEVVFQLTGVDNPDCGGAKFEIIPAYPFSYYDNETMQTISGSTYISGYKKAWMIPYRLRVDESALASKSEIEVRYAPGTTSGWTFYTTKKFNITLEDMKVDFEISVKSYDAATDLLTFEILNVGKADVEALTVDIPNQDNIIVKGSSRNIVGSLDKNEETTFEFTAIPKEGDIKLTIKYNDNVDERRTITKNVFFDSKSFSLEEPKKTSIWMYLLAVIAIIVLVYLLFFRKKKR